MRVKPRGVNVVHRSYNHSVPPTGRDLNDFFVCEVMDQFRYSDVCWRFEPELAVLAAPTSVNMPLFCQEHGMMGACAKLRYIIH